MRQPARIGGMNPVLGFLWSCGSDLTHGSQPRYKPSTPARLCSRITIKHAVTRLLAGGLLFLVVSAAHATAPIGATSGSFAVGPSGAATYSIPIFVPPGTNGMQPQISLNYNSQGGNGLLGMGWSIDGLSVIHRCGSTIAIDGTKGGVNYDVNDKFCLDGERLISIGGSEYRTQHESWQKVVAVGGTVSDPSYFTVTAKDGTVQYYGATTDSRIEAAGHAQGSGIARLWALNKVQDRNGNYFTITYQEENAVGDFRPVSIVYTGNINTSTSAYNTIFFDYLSRSDIAPVYEGGSVIKITQRLDKIRANTGASPVREYRLAYDYNGAAGRSRLTSVQECGSDGVCLPATSFGWLAGVSSFGVNPIVTDLAGTGWSAASYPRQFADVNGDGLTDLVLILNSEAEAHVFLSKSDGSFETTPVSTDVTGSGWTESAYPRYLNDVNGDGRVDLILISSSDAQIYAFLAAGNGSFAVNPIVTDLAGTGWSAASYPRQFADVNGDGLTDLVLILNSEAEAHVFLSKSDGSFETTPVSTDVTGSGWTESAYPRRLADVNGDGKSDLALVEESEAIVYAFISKGDGTFTLNPATTDINGSGWNSNYYKRYFVDTNGDGKQDLVLLPDDEAILNISYANFPQDLLVSAVNGLGVATDIIYKPLTDSSVYTKDNNAAYPYLDFQYAMYVVSQSAQSNGIGGNNTTAYQYGGLKTHHTGATSLGFRWIQTTDPAGMVHVTNHNQTLDCTEGTVASSETWASGVRVKYAGNTWAPVSFGAGRCYARLASSVEETRELNNSVVSTVNASYSGYDSYGNPGMVTVDFNDGWSKTTLNTYDNDTVNWQLGKLTYAKVTATAPGQSSEYRESAFTYDALGRMQTEVIEPNRSTLTLTTAFGYDSFGNRTSKTLSGPDIVSRTESQTFTANGQFPLTKTNAPGHSESYVHDSKYGTVTSQTGPNGLTTTWSYDGFGRKVVEIRPDGTSTVINYKCWNGAAPTPPATCPTGEGYATETLASGSGAVWAYFDILGRPVRSARISYDGIWVYTDAAYDNLGRQISASQPDFNNPPAHHTTYTHDALGRVLTATAPGNRVTSTAYNGLTTTVTNPKNQTLTTVKNSQGAVVNATDAGGTTSYVYDPFGNLKSVIAVDGVVTSMTYDIRGRKTAMNDPDMGAWSYVYNVLGELTSQTDAKNQTITMAYDKLGRMTSRVLPNGEGTSTWTYDTATKGIGKLASVSNPNATETYTYDSLSRPSTQTVSVSGITYTVTTAYDTLGRVDKITYPETGFRLKHVYDANQFGFLKEIKNDVTGTSYWKINVGGVDAQNRIINETYGNGLISQRQYAAGIGDLDFIKTGTAGNPTSVQNQTYGFDELGNVTARGWWDGTAQRNEIFGYDNLNRLTTVTGPANKTYAYAPNGNITSKTSVGTYTYSTNGIRPHAVSSIAGAINTSFTYDANGNMLTGNGRTLTYTSFNKVKTAAKGSITDTFTYDASFNRLIKSNGSGTTIYIGKLYERVTSGSTVTQKHYIYAGPNQVGVYSKVNTTTSMRYFHTDHLGSVDTITNETGGVVQRLSYDAWGKRRNVNGTDATSITAQTTRGFTRHEHDDEVGLVNMNAREFDPLLGRFVTPDTIIQFPYSSQGMNRYTYVNNNPLSFTDPSGHGLFKSLKKAVQKIAKAGIDIARAPSRAVDHYITRPVIRHIAKHHPNALPYLRGAAVAVGSFFGGPAGGAAVAAKFDYETCRAMGCDANDAMRAGLKGGATHYASVFVSDVFGSSNAGVSKISLSQTIGNSLAQTAVAQYADRQGIHPIVFNAGLFAVSWSGNAMVGSRYDANLNHMNGIGNRYGPLGLPFDAADILLEMQGYLSASSQDYLSKGGGNRPYLNFELTGHSLGALSVANLVGQEYAPSGTVYSLPFGKIAAGNITVNNGWADIVNLGPLGLLPNPDANYSCGCVGHAFKYYQ